MAKKKREFNFNDNEMDYLESLKDDIEKSAEAGEYINFHKFAAPGKSKVHYFIPIVIPEELKEHYHNMSIARPKFSLFHKSIKKIWSNGRKPQPILDLFPDSSVNNIKCTGDDTCLVCKKIIKERERLEKLPGKTDEEQICLDRLKGMLQKKGKYEDMGKEVVAFVGLSLEKDDKDRKKFHRKIEAFLFPRYYWDQSIVKDIINAREEEQETWVDEHWDETFKLGKNEKALSEYTERQQKAIFILNTKGKYKLPWNMLHGFTTMFKEAIDEKRKKEFKTLVHKPFPYFPPEMIEHSKGQQKKDMKKLEEKAKKNYEWLCEMIEAGKFPDLEAICPDEITAEDQAKILNVKADKESDDVSDEAEADVEDIDMNEDTEDFEESEESDDSDDTEDSYEEPETSDDSDSDDEDDDDSSDFEEDDSEFSTDDDDEDDDMPF